MLKVHAGRYHPQITTGEFTNVIGPSIKPYYLGYGYNRATGTFDDLSLFSSNENLRVDPDYRAPRTDQFLVGFERELFQNVGLQLAYIRKWGRDFPGWDETAGTYEQIPVVDDTGKDPTGATIKVFKLTSDPGARQFQITNTDKVFTDVHAVTATLTKRMTSWYANATVTWLRAEGLVGGSATGSTIQQRSALEFNPFGRNPNDYVNAVGRLNGDIGWQFKLQFVWQLPAGFVFSTNADYREGGHRLRLRSLPASVTGVSSLVSMSPRGTFGRLPSFTIIDARPAEGLQAGRQQAAVGLRGRPQPEQRGRQPGRAEPARDFGCLPVPVGLCGTEAVHAGSEGELLASHGLPGREVVREARSAQPGCTR